MMAEVNTLQMVFEAAQAGGDPLGLWQSPVAHLPADEAVPELAAWRIDLPANPRRAEKALAASQARLALAGLALPAADARLGAFVGNIPRAGLGFAAAAGEAPSPEAELAGFLRRTERTARQSYGLDDLLPQIRELMAAVNRLADNVRLSLANFALVETSQAGRLIGRTQVSWLGDFSSQWGAGIDPLQASLHRKAVEQTLATRQSWVRIGLSVAAGGASLASATLGNPLALLGVFQFVRQVIREFQEKVDPTLRR